MPNWATVAVPIPSIVRNWVTQPWGREQPTGEQIVEDIVGLFLDGLARAAQEGLVLSSLDGLGVILGNSGRRSHNDGDEDEMEGGRERNGEKKKGGER